LALWLQAEKIEHFARAFGTNSAEVAMFAHELGGPKWSFLLRTVRKSSTSRNLSHCLKRFDAAAFVAGSVHSRRSQLFAAPHTRDGA